MSAPSRTERSELWRLRMRLERGRSEQATLRTLLAAANTVVALRRLDVRALKAQIAIRLRSQKPTT